MFAASFAPTVSQMERTNASIERRKLLEQRAVKLGWEKHSMPCQLWLTSFVEFWITKNGKQVLPIGTTGLDDFERALKIDEFMALPVELSDRIKARLEQSA